MANDQDNQIALAGAPPFAQTTPAIPIIESGCLAEANQARTARQQTPGC
jgi:hypothetical protein